MQIAGVVSPKTYKIIHFGTGFLDAKGKEKMTEKDGGAGDKEGTGIVDRGPILITRHVYRELWNFGASAQRLSLPT